MYSRMLDIIAFPHDIQQMIWVFYTSELRRRMRRAGLKRLISAIFTFCNDNRSMTTHLLDWMAHVIQHPWTKPIQNTIALVGDASVSESFVRLIARLVPIVEGDDRPQRLSILPEFEDAKVVVEHDCSSSSLSKLRTLISDHAIAIRRSSEDPVRIVRSSHRFLLIYRTLPSSMPPELRRVAVVHCANSGEIRETLGEVTIKDFRCWLMRRSVSQ